MWKNLTGEELLKKIDEEGGDLAAGGYVPPSQFDPTMILTLKATTQKALQVVSFVPDYVRQRVGRKKRETLRFCEGTDGSFSIKADETSQVYLSQAEWSSANQRLMHQLILEKKLPLNRIKDYMAYTTTIHDYVSRYDWQSILDFDVRYREIQAEHGFRWGTPASNLESLVLVTRRQAQPAQYQAQHQAGGRPPHNRGQNRRVGKTQEACRQYQRRGECDYGDSCKYQHVEPPQSTE